MPHQHPIAARLNSHSFSLTIEQLEKETKMLMTVKNPYINTRYLPHTMNIIQRHIPSVLRTRCFNDANLPFDKEILHTEIGHLFEHVLLEYLCQLKLSLGFRRVVFNGNTDWNWKRDPYGTFNISIDVGRKERFIFSEALRMTTPIIEEILVSRPDYLRPPLRPAVLASSLLHS